MKKILLLFIPIFLCSQPKFLNIKWGESREPVIQKMLDHGAKNEIITGNVSSFEGGTFEEFPVEKWVLDFYRNKFYSVHITFITGLDNEKLYGVMINEFSNNTGIFAYKDYTDSSGANCTTYQWGYKIKNKRYESVLSFEGQKSSLGIIDSTTFRLCVNENTKKRPKDNKKR